MHPPSARLVPRLEASFGSSDLPHAIAGATSTGSLGFQLGDRPLL